MLSILDLNIWNYNKWPARRGLIIQTIREANPDLVALQEITYLGSYQEDPRHQADQLMSGLSGYQMVWQPAMYYHGRPEEAGATRWEGVTIMSRFPIIDRRHIRLSHDPQDEGDYHQRVVLGCRVLSPDGPFWLFTTHYSLSAVMRERNAVETYDFVRATAEQDPFAVTGDFNAHPDHSPIQFLTGEAPLQGRRGDWIDAWAALHPTEPGYTASPWNPWERIDYAFVPRREMIVSIEIAADKADAQGLYPSDHLGLLARLQF